MLDVRSVVLDDDIGALGEAMKDRPALRLLEIEGDAALVAMQVLEIEAMPRPSSSA
jgi:hypothetical protein